MGLRENAIDVSMRASRGIIQMNDNMYYVCGVRRYNNHGCDVVVRLLGDLDENPHSVTKVHPAILGQSFFNLPASIVVLRMKWRSE